MTEPVKEPLRRRRALRLDVAEARVGRQALAPLSEKLLVWHQATALLTARFNRAQLRGGYLADLLPDIEALLQQVYTEFEEWRAGLDGSDKTGRVDDGVRSGIMILKSLANLRRQAYRAA